MSSKQQKTLLINSDTKQVFFTASRVLGKFHGTKELQAFRSVNKENNRTTPISLSFSGNNKDDNVVSFHQMVAFINKSKESDNSGHTVPTTKVQIHHMELGDDTIFRELVVSLKNLNIKHLEMRYCGITDIAGLAALTQLESLNLDGNQITDITRIAVLKRLKTLILSGNQITDITSLAALAQLERLDLKMNKITDITGLSTITRLKTLILDGNEITDITSLATLTELESLNLGSNQITDITSLSTLT